MTIKTILVPLDNRERSLETLNTALVVAKRFGAHIQTIHVSESSLMSATFNNVSSDLRSSVLEEEKVGLREIAGEVKAAVEKFAGENNLELSDNPAATQGISISFAHEYGEVNDVLIHWSRYHDTVAINRPVESASRLSLGGAPSIVESLLMVSGKPVLLVPPDWQARRAHHALIAWNDSLEASRALSMTIPWLAQMDSVTVVVAKARQESGARVLEHLGWHGIDAQVQVLNRGMQSVGARIQGIAKEVEADFLVMGGYSQGRLKQRIFGGVTDYMLSNSEIITVMVH